MRRDYHEYQNRDAEIIAIGPDSAEKMQEYWEQKEFPFPGVSDPNKDSLSQLGQEFKWLKFGRMPAVIAVDSDGEVQYAHYGNSAADIPENTEVLAALDEHRDDTR